jgi:putative membrane protein insertion efficiency factor
MKAAGEYIITFISNLLNPNRLHVCRFVPSCSVYAREAWRMHAAPLAAFLIIVRLWRCRPFGRTGYDPVPQRAQL